MIGLRIGVAVGPRLGNSIGIGNDTITNPCAVPAATLDPLGQRYTPQNATEWAAVLAFAGIATGGPFAAWGFQEAASPIADLIGAFPLTISGTAPTFQFTVAGWSRFGVLLADLATTSVQNNSASIPDVASESFMVLAYRMLTVTAARGVIAVGTTNRARLEEATTPAIAGFNPLNSTTGTGSPLQVVRPLILQVDRTASALTIYSDLEVLSVTWDGTINGKFLQFGNAVKQCAAGPLLYAAAFRGAAAEMTQAKVRNLQQALAFTPTW